MNIKQIITFTFFFIGFSISFAQSNSLDKDISVINTLMKENGLNDKLYTQLSIKNDQLIFENIGKEYKLKNTDKRVLTIDKIQLKKIKLKSSKRPNKTFTSKIEFKTKGKAIYSKTLRGNYSKCFLFLNVKDKSVAENIKNMISELIEKLQE
ncbi:hypothetical protein [Tenacibaculum sp. M341]|uniref:hypothetical protein n=1 Tax=Tenacibaculum sp. M341 TaxID=2530339 RepID=UPI00104C39F7|nr:hypothetical protein [Tenacibaculum sp. M341]TCI90634.1 hypothetical protein EYW44_12990 [Tenacibaculum sp. M341]